MSLVVMSLQYNSVFTGRHEHALHNNAVFAWSTHYLYWSGKWRLFGFSVNERLPRSGAGDRSGILMVYR